MITPIQFTTYLLNQPRVGHGAVRTLFEMYPSFDDLVSSFETNDEISDAMKQKIFKALSHNPEEIKEKVVCLWDSSYPRLLKEIADPPARIFYRGNLSAQILSKCVSIVGTRKATSYGEKVINKFINELVGYGITVVSGMAFGIDSMAHRACLAEGVKTIAVLGSAIDEPTPRAHEALYEEIVESGGLIISEFAPDTETQPGMFASRNRIIAGLSHVTIVIEADYKSGALITSSLALDNGREVYAVPGPITAQMSHGTNKAIANHEAQLLYSTDQILANLAIKQSASHPKVSLSTFSQSEQEVLEYLLIHQLASIDEISRNTSLDDAVEITSKLELQGVLTRTAGAYELSIIVE